MQKSCEMLRIRGKAMIYPMIRIFAVLLLGAASAATAFGSTMAVKKAYVDKAGRAHIVTSDGGDHTIRPEKWQAGAGFEDIKIASDGVTAGWLADQEFAPFDGAANYSYPRALELDIWRSGRVIRKFPAPSLMIGGWRFLKGGKEIAFHIVPPHGMEFYECFLFDVDSGKELAQWSLDRKDYVIPDWAKPLLKDDPPPGPDEVSAWIDQLKSTPRGPEPGK